MCLHAAHFSDFFPTLDIYEPKLAYCSLLQKPIESNLVTKVHVRQDQIHGMYSFWLADYRLDDTGVVLLLIDEQTDDESVEVRLFTIW